MGLINNFLSKKNVFLISFFVCNFTNVFLVFLDSINGMLVSRFLGYFMLFFYYYFSVKKIDFILTFYLVSALISSILIYDYPVLATFFSLLYKILILFYCLKFYKFQYKDISYTGVGLSAFFLISIVSYGIYINFDELLRGDFLFLLFAVLMEVVSIITTLLIVVNLMKDFSDVNFTFFYGVVNLIISDVITSLYDIDLFDGNGIVPSTIFRVIIGQFLIIYSAVLANKK